MRSTTYEALGVRRIYRVIAGIVGEELLPPVGTPLEGVSRSQLEERRTATRYFENANYARAACYIPHMASFIAHAHVTGAAYTSGLLILHGLVSMLERYKRQLIDAHLAEAPESVPTPHVGDEPDAHHSGLADLWYRPKRFETERFYRLIGMEAFRAFVGWVMRTLTYGFSGKRVVTMPVPTRAQAVEFERETRLSEGVHLVGVALTLPTVVFAWQQPWIAVSIWATVVLFGEIGLTVLQRFHRARLWPVVSRVLARKAKT